jgi:uncharacterized membrane protein
VAEFLGHPVHQMLVVFPLGLLATAVIFDVIFLANDNETMALVGYSMIAAGIIGGLLAAPFGWDRLDGDSAGDTSEVSRVLAWRR